MSADVQKRLVHLYERMLKRRGWDRSLVSGPVDEKGMPVPWITYSAYSMLCQIVRPNFKVFEFGCGHSSLWWARQVQEVVSVDHDPRWIQRLQPNKPNNLTLIHCVPGTDSSMFAPEIRNRIDAIITAQALSPDTAHNVMHGLDCRNFLSHPTVLARWPKQYFDVVVVDGMARSICAYIAGLWVKKEGFVVFDNSDRWQYSPGFEALRDLGFARIDFFGTGPVNSYEWCTSIFAKSIMPFMQIAPRAKIINDLGW